jgi:dTDP-glucose 4,6-dehydratase
VTVTGGAGFIGSNLVRWILSNEPDVQVVVLDALTYAGNLESLADVEAQHGARGTGRYHLVHGDIRDAALVRTILSGSASGSPSGRPVPAPDALLHLAAESHVDRSIIGPDAFVATNVQGTHTLLECVRAELAVRARPFRFINIRTDEVYGSLTATEPAFTERHALRPNSPYSASKAGADCLVRAYRETFGLPCLTTRCSNNYGPYQFPEKLIPLMITQALGDRPLPVYGDGLHVRDWIHVSDHASALWAVCTRGQLEDEVYNIGGEAETTNVAIVRMLLDELAKPESLVQYVTDRPGHDRRYAMDNTFIRERLGWQPERTLRRGLAETVEWYLGNRGWWERVQSKAYRSAHAIQHGTS